MQGTAAIKDYGLKDYVGISKDLPHSENAPWKLVCGLPYNCHFQPWIEVEAPADKEIRFNSSNPLVLYLTKTETCTTRSGISVYEAKNWVSGEGAIYTIPAGVTVKAVKHRETGCLQQSRHLRITRRKFIAAATSVTAFAMVRRHVLGGPGKTPPGETLSMAGIGAGGQGYTDLMDVSRAGGNIVALCDVDENRGGKAFEQFPQAKRHRDFVLLLDFRMPTVSDSGIFFRKLIPEIPNAGDMEQFNLRARGGMAHLESYEFLPKETAAKMGLKEEEKPHVRYIDPEVGIWHTVKLTLNGRTFSAEYDGEVRYDRLQYHDWMIYTGPAHGRIERRTTVRNRATVGGETADRS
jgi:hypothetical protein